MTAEFDYDVYLSYNGEDRPRVRRLAERLREAGVRVWLDDWVIRPGDDIFMQIERGLERSRTLVLCMSRAALGADWVTLERNTVLFRDPANKARRFIPLLLADCTIPDALKRYRYVDYREEAENAFEELLAACRSSQADLAQGAHRNGVSEHHRAAARSHQPGRLAARRQGGQACHRRRLFGLSGAGQLVAGTCRGVDLPGRRVAGERYTGSGRLIRLLLRAQQYHGRRGVRHEPITSRPIGGWGGGSDRAERWAR